MLKKLQQLVYGDRGVFLFIPKSKQKNQYILGVKVLHKLALDGYKIEDSKLLLAHPQEFMEQFMALTESSTKEGVILRKSFGSTQELDSYTKEEWMAILAMYSISYGWSEQYKELVGENPSDITKEYLSDKSFSQKFTLPTATKVIKVWGISEIKELIGDIICSKMPLREQQEQTLVAFGETYKEELATVANELSDKIVMKEILVLIMKLTKGSKTPLFVFKTIKDILRFIALNFAITPIKGQVTNRKLTYNNYRFKTSDKKIIKFQIDALVRRKGFKATLADMFPNERFWRRISNLLSYQSKEKERRKYPNYYGLIDVLHDKSYDRSWTYNSQLTRSLQEYRYDDAIELATQRAGIFFRQLILFIKMKKGLKIPRKISNFKYIDNANIEKDRLKEQLDQIFHNRVEKSNIKYIERDAYAFFKSKKFDAFLEKELNPKLGYQVLEEIKKGEHLVPIINREVQNTPVNYIVPIPPLDIDMTNFVVNKIKRKIDSKKYKINKKLGKVYIDSEICIPIQFSGRNEKSIVFSGIFLPQFSKISIDSLRGGVNRKRNIMRVGVMWKSLSENDIYIDLDHSLFIDDRVCWYAEPIYYSKSNKIIAISSGDLTFCPSRSSNQFSTELIDIDLEEAVANGNRVITNLVNNYKGRGLDKAEIYFFVSFISKEDRVQKGQKIKIELDKVEYAFKLPKTKQNGCFGISLSLKNMQLTVLNNTISKKIDDYTNILNFESEYNELMKKSENAPSLAKKLVNVVDITDNVSEADLLIAYDIQKFDNLKDEVIFLNPLKNLERVNELLF